MWAVGLASGLILLAPSAEVLPDQLAQQVRQLVSQLDADRLAERQAAEEQLLALGTDVLPHLPQPRPRDSAELRQRLVRIRRTLQLRAARKATEASRVTLSGSAVPLSQVLSALAEQSGNQVVDFRPQFGQQVTDPVLKVDFHETPFWEALDYVLGEAQLELYGFGEPRAISLVARTPSQRPRRGAACYRGPLRIEPIRLVAQRELGRSGGDSLKVVLAVMWEPRLRLISLSQKLGDVKAVDEHGNLLPVEDDTAELSVPTGAKTAVQLMLPFQLPPRGVTQIARLEGKLACLIPGPLETFRFKRLTQARKVQQRIAGVTVTLQEVRRSNDDGWLVRLQVQFDETAGAMASHFGWVYDNEAYLEGPDGRRTAYDSQEFVRQSEAQLGIVYVFLPKDPLEQQSFVYRTPSVIAAAEFDYQFEGLPLP